MIKAITLGGRDVPYELIRKKVRNINLRIRSDGTVCVSAHDHVTESTIEAFLQKKTECIISALDKFAELAKYVNTQRHYVSGESFRHLGKDLRLVVAQGRNSVMSDGIYLIVNAEDMNNTELKARLIDRWYNTQCRDVFKDIVDQTYPIFRKYGVPLPKLTLRDMSSRWGSCRPKRGMITLNKRLIETPRNAIEYVVMHEFTHFLHANHSAKFYNMLSAIMPDWKVRKQLLENMMRHTSRQ